MKFGVRDICNVVFKAKADTVIGDSTFKKGQPVLYIDTATASSLEQSTTTVYAQGGRGNARLIAWEGEKNLTFTVTDALLSPVGLAVLSGAGLFKKEATKVHVHTTATAPINTDEGQTTLTISLGDALGPEEEIDETAPVFISVTENDGSITGTLITDATVAEDEDFDNRKVKITATPDENLKAILKAGNATALVDFYVVKDSVNVSEIQIDASNFGGYYYVEASTLFRRQSDGVDMPAEITLPNVKIQSNFTFNMAATGDPSTFDFVMDAFPGYTMFDRTHKVQCVIQVIEDATAGTTVRDSVMKHSDDGKGFRIDESYADSTPDKGGQEVAPVI